MNDEIMVCDNCERACLDCTGDRDVAVFCCLCRLQSAREHGPRNFEVELCDECREVEAA